MILGTRRTLIAISIAFGLVGCGDKDAASDLLAYVPADTPYVLANQKTTPRAVTEAWMNMYGIDVSELYNDMAQSPDMLKLEGDVGVWLRAAMPEFGKMATIKGLEELGLSVEPRFAVYGYGLMPVYRIELSNPKNLLAAVERIEARAGKTLTKRKFDELELWQFADDKVTVLFGAIGQQLVVTVAPANADEARLKAQLGLTLPKASLASSGALQALDKQYGYDGHVSGFMDIRGLAQRLSGRNEADNQVITAFGGEIPQLSAACISEMDSMTQKFPRLVFGTTQIDAKHMQVNSIVETDKELAGAMQKLAAAIPGSDSNASIMFRLAMSVDLPETMRFLGGIADSIAAKPFQCEALADLNSSAAEMKQNMANPAMAMAGSVNAMHLGVQSLKMEPGAEMPSQLSAFLTLGSSSPVMLWGLAQQSVSALAKVQLTTDGKIVALPSDAVPMPFPLEFKAIMTDKSVGLATTDIEDSNFTAAATVPANNDGTLLRYSFSGEFFKLIANNMPAPGPEVDEATAKEAERARKMLAGIGEGVDHFDVRMRLTDRGIEMSQESVLK